MIIVFLAITGWLCAALFCGLFLLTLWTWKRIDAAKPGESVEEIARQHGGSVWAVARELAGRKRGKL